MKIKHKSFTGDVTDANFSPWARPGLLFGVFPPSLFYLFFCWVQLMASGDSFVSCFISLMHHNYFLMSLSPHHQHTVQWLCNSLQNNLPFTHIYLSSVCMYVCLCVCVLCMHVCLCVCVLCMHAYMYICRLPCACHGVHVQVRWLLVEVSLPLLLQGSQWSKQISRLDQAHLPAQPSH